MTLPETYSPALPVPLIAALAGGALLVAGWRALRGRPLRPAWMQGPVLLLRAAAIALLALLMLNPSDNITLPATEARPVILLDRSGSMALAAEQDRTRWQEAQAWTEEALAALHGPGGRRAAVLTFGSGALTPWKKSDQPANDAETQFAAALESLAAGAAGGRVSSAVIVSDGGAHDRAGLSAALGALRAAGIQVSAKTVGIDRAPRNAGIVSVHAPRALRPGSRVSLPVTVEAAGFAAGESFALTLRDDAGTVMARDEFQMSGSLTETAAQERRLTYTSAPQTTRCTLELSAPAGEVTADDNRFTFTVEAVTAKMRVLMVEGTHVKRTVGTEGHWYNDIELMTTAWDASGEIEWEVLTPLSEYVDKPNLVGVKQFVNAEMLLDPSRGFPKTREEIFKYDVMLISDVPVGNFSEEQMSIVTEWVTERGGGFLMGGGYTSFDVGNYDQTPWERIIPVDMLAYGDGFYENTGSPFRIAVPQSVMGHPIWQMDADPVKNAEIIATHPPFTGLNRVRRAKPGALVLATRPEAGDEPVFTAQQYGRGRSIAYLPDPNGGWAKYLVSWSPPGGPPHGPHTEQGHGERFVFDEVAAKSARGPRPPHPSPYYARFWTNVVKWLGANSIRWRRDKLAGRIAAAQVQPGQPVPVAAEVLAVTSQDALAVLDVGARLDIPGSARVRLTWDRDRREFTGTLPAPPDMAGEDVRALFDVTAGRETFTDIATAGLRRTGREFTNTAPDHRLMEELATASGGTVLHAPADVLSAVSRAESAQAAAERRTFLQPAWTRWPWWAAVAALLSLEWLLRRRAGAQPLQAL